MILKFFSKTKGANLYHYFKLQKFIPNKKLLTDTQGLKEAKCCTSTIGQNKL